MKLFGYWRSSAAYRVRIALNLKALDAEMVPIHLAKGEQKGADYRALNPQGLVPCLELEDGTVIAQSLAIIDYLEETHPTPPLLPAAPLARARVRALAQTIAVDIHPVNNLRILKYLKTPLGIPEAAKDAWYAHWIIEGFTGLEESLAREPAAPDPFVGGTTPGLFEICLIPQMYNAHRFAVDLSAFPRLRAIETACLALPAFDRAAPENQADAG